MSSQEIGPLADAEDGHVPLTNEVPEGNWDDFNEEAAALIAALDAEPVSDYVPVEEWPGFLEQLDACIAADEGLKVLDVSPTATSPDKAHDLGDSPVRGSTSSFPTSLSPGSEHEEDTDSDLGSELTPEEWAELNGEAPPPPPPPPAPAPAPSTESKSRKASKARTRGGKKKKAKSQLVERRDVIAKLREDTIRAQTITSLDRAIAHIQSKVAAKTRQIFIDNSLLDIVMHGQTEAEDVMTDNDVSALPKVYHTHWKSEPNYRLLTKHMDLHNDVKLNDVYISLGLNVGRGKDLYETIKQLLAAPGCSLRVDGDLTDEHKILVAELAHELLAVVGWGFEHFQRPTLTGREGKDQVVGQKTWGYASTDIFLGFCKLLYKAAKYHEGRRKGTNRRIQNAQPAVPEPSEPQEQQPLLAEPPAPAPVAPIPTITITAPSPSAPRFGPNYMLNNNATNKRPHNVLDLTSGVDDGGVGPSKPPKRARTTSTQKQTRQTQNVQQRPPPFVPLGSQTLPQSPRTLEQPQQMTYKQRQIRAQIEAYQRLITQRNQGLPQHHHQAPQHDHQQQLRHQILMIQQSQQNRMVSQSQMSQRFPQQPQAWPPYQVPQQPHTLPRNQMAQQPRAMPQNHHQNTQRSQGFYQFQGPLGPQSVPQFASPQRSQMMAAAQFPSPQRPQGLATQFQSSQRASMTPPSFPSPQRPEGLARQFQSPQHSQMMGPPQIPRPQMTGPPQIASPQRSQGLARQFQSPQRPQMMATPPSQATQPPPWAHLQSIHNSPPRP